MKLGIILGTRPEIIKMSPLIRECIEREIDFFVLHTGQHYSDDLDKIFFRDLELPEPKYNLGVGGEPYRKQVGMMIKEISNVLIKERPDVIIVQGDTISVLAGALAADKLGIKIAHHEAGLRSHDTTMLEEINRVIVDHISDFLFVPTPDALKNLYEEGKDPHKIVVSGNTIVDAVMQNGLIAEQKSKILENLNLKPKEYILVTSHRAENVDAKNRLRGILEGISLVQKKLGIPVIFPIHPRTQKRIKEFELPVPGNIKFIEPVGFLDFLTLEKNAKLVMTDSGGAQEESFILGVPCVTLRDNTERPETIEEGANMLAGAEPEKILECAQIMINKEKLRKNRVNPFGKGDAAKIIIDTLTRQLIKNE